MKHIVILAAGGAIAVAALAGGLSAAERLPPGLPPSAALLLRFDADKDGLITKAEMEEGLKADYAAADSNSDACVDPSEVRSENALRLRRDATQASPLVDWNLDGCVDIREFGNTAHSYFDLADRTKDGRVSQLELRGPAMPVAPRVIPAPAKSATETAGPASSTTGISPATAGPTARLLVVRTRASCDPAVVAGANISGRQRP